MYTTTNRAGTIRVELADECWGEYVAQYGARAREMVLTLAGQCVEHRKIERIGADVVTDAEIEAEYIRDAGNRALVDRYGMSGLSRRLAGGMLSDGAEALIAAGEESARMEIRASGVPREFAEGKRKHVVEMHVFQTRCAHRSDMTVIEL